MARGERRHAASGCLWRWTSYGAKRLGEERGSIGRRAHRHVLHRSVACASVVPLAVFIEAVHLRAVARLHSAVTHACAPGAGAGCQSRGGCQPPSVQGVSWPSLWAFSSLHAGAWTGAQRRTGQRFRLRAAPTPCHFVSQVAARLTPTLLRACRKETLRSDLERSPALAACQLAGVLWPIWRRLQRICYSH